MLKVCIDGSAGTTGLKIRQRLEKRDDVELVVLDDAVRKDPAARYEACAKADAAFFCLPDQAAKEAAEACEGLDTVIIDTSTAHRCSPGWVYGFAELVGRDEIFGAKRIANPGCHASGFAALVKPLVDAGALKKDALLSCFSLTGYSGGGKKMIAQYEEQEISGLLKAPRQYGLTQSHKHLPEVKKICSLEYEPAFCPTVSDFFSGMEVTVPLFSDQVNCPLSEIAGIYSDLYKGPVVTFCPDAPEDGFISAAELSGKDGMKIGVFGNSERAVAVAVFDNLGKGASGAAIQNLNIAFGLDETLGLEL